MPKSAQASIPSEQDDPELSAQAQLTRIRAQTAARVARWKARKKASIINVSDDQQTSVR